MALPSNPDWTALPIDILESILDYLIPMENYLAAFIDVCVEWKSAVGQKLQKLRSKHKRLCHQHERLPLIMLPSTDHKLDGRYCLFDLITRKRLCSVESWPKGWICEGSSDGWLILVHEHSYEVILREPFSGREIYLPPIQKEKHLGYWEFLRQSSVFLSARRRYALSINPEEFVLMITWIRFHDFGVCHQSIAFFKSGNKDWTHIYDLCEVRGIVYVGGLFYVVDACGGLYSCEVGTDGVYKVTKIASPNHPYYSYRSYLVDSPEGNPLWVVRHKYGPPNFKIYKLIWFRKKLRWRKITFLGDLALFLGNDQSISVPISDFPRSQTSHRDNGGCQSNSIYFSDSHYDRTSKASYGYLNVFNIHDSSVTTLYKYKQHEHDYEHQLSPPIWISSKFV